MISGWYSTISGHATHQRQIREMGWQEPHEIIVLGKLCPALMEEKNTMHQYMLGTDQLESSFLGKDREIQVNTKLNPG